MAEVTAIRATLVGVHAGLTDALVVDPAEGPGPPDELAGHRVAVVPIGPRSREVIVDGWRFEVQVEPERRAALRARAARDRSEHGHSGPAEVRAIIPGVVLSVAVAAGDEVAAGQELLVVEAMKMQNELRAPRAGRVARVAVGERSTIDVGELLVVIE